MKNPREFKEHDLIESIYTGKVYEVLVPEKQGMAKLIHLESGLIEDWNAHNNSHFERFTGQTKLNFNI